MRRLIFKICWSFYLIFNRNLNFWGWGSESVQIINFVLSLIWGCSKCIWICSICALNVVGAALFTTWAVLEETILLNLCSEPIQSNSSNFQVENIAMIEENAQNQTANQNMRWESELFQDVNRAICMHLEQPQVRFKTNRKFEHFLSLSIRN